MPKESTIQHYSSSTTGATPAAIDLSTGELAINIADEKVFFKNLGGTVVSLSQTKDLSGAFAASSKVVSSVNGATGAITNVAFTNAAQSFSGLQTFTNGISGVGATFAGMVSVAEFLARTVGGDEGGELKLGLAATNTTLTGTTVTIDVYQNRLRFFESGGNARGYYMDLSTASNGAGSQLSTSTPYSPPLATSSVTGVASFAAADFTVSATGAVNIKGAVTSFNGATGSVSFYPALATSSVTGVASFNSADFTVASGAVSLTNAARTNAANTFTSLQTFSAGLSGNLTGNATTVTVTDRNTGTQFLCMAGGTGETGIFIDRTTTPLQYAPSIGRITTSSISLTSGGASTTIGANTITSTSFLSTTVAESMDFITSSTNPVNSSIYFSTPNGDVAFGDVYQTGTQNALSIFAGGNIMAYSSALSTNIGKLKFGINRNGLGWTGQFGYGIELGQDSSRMLRMTRILDTFNDQSTTGPTCNTTFDLDSNGDLTIKPSGGDLIVSGALTVTGTGLSGNVTINNGLSVVGGATFSSSLAVNGNVTLGDSATDTTTIYGSKVVNEFVFNNGTARTVGISWANGNVQLLGGTGSGATGVTAIYFTNPPATGSASVTLIVTSGGNMTGNTNFWATNIKWPGGNKPTLSSNGTPDVISFVTPDAGTTIYGFVGGLNFA